LKPKNLWEERISEVELKSQRAKIKNGKKLNPKVKIVKILSHSYDGIRLCDIQKYFEYLIRCLLLF